MGGKRRERMSSSLASVKHNCEHFAGVDWFFGLGYLFIYLFWSYFAVEEYAGWDVGQGEGCMERHMLGWKEGSEHSRDK